MAVRLGEDPGLHREGGVGVLEGGVGELDRGRPAVEAERLADAPRVVGRAVDQGAVVHPLRVDGAAVGEPPADEAVGDGGVAVVDAHGEGLAVGAGGAEAVGAGGGDGLDLGGAEGAAVDGGLVDAALEVASGEDIVPADHQGAAVLGPAAGDLRGAFQGAVDVEADLPAGLVGRGDVIPNAGLDGGGGGDGLAVGDVEVESVVGLGLEVEVVGELRLGHDGHDASGGGRELVEVDPGGVGGRGRQVQGRGVIRHDVACGPVEAEGLPGLAGGVGHAAEGAGVDVAGRVDGVALAPRPAECVGGGRGPGDGTRAGVDRGAGGAGGEAVGQCLAGQVGVGRGGGRGERVAGEDGPRGDGREDRGVVGGVGELGDEGVPVAGAGGLHRAGGRGEVRGGGEAADVGHARGVEGDGLRAVVGGAAEEGGVERAAAGGVELGDEAVPGGVGGVAERRQEGVGGGEVGRPGHADDVGVAGGVQGDGLAVVVGGAAEVGRVDECGAGGIEFGDVGVPAPAGGGLVGVDEGEVEVAAAPGEAGEVGVARGIDGDALAVVVGGAAEVGRVGEGGGAALGGVELGDEDVPGAALGSLVGARGDGVVGGSGVAGEVGVARGVDGDGGAAVVAGAAEEGRVGERGAGGVDAGGEHVAGAAAVRPLESAGGGEEAGGLRHARDPGVAGGVHGDDAVVVADDARVVLVAGAAQVGGVGEGAGGVELGDEGVGAAAEGGLCGAAGGGEVRGGGVAGDVDVVGAVEGEGVGAVVPRAAEVGRVNAGGAGGVELGDEGVGVGAVGALSGAGGGEVGGLGEAGDVGGAGAVHGDAEALVGGAAAEEGGGGEGGVDDQRVIGVVGADGEAHQPVCIDDVVPIDGVAYAVDVLVEDGRLGDDPRPAGHDGEVALSVHAHGVGAGEAEADLGGVGARGDEEVVLELGGVAVEHHVHAGVQALVLDRAVVRDAGEPAGRVGAEKVVAGAFLEVEAVERDGGLGADHLHADGARGGGAGAGEGEDGLIGGQEQAVAVAPREEADLRIGLAEVLLEAQGERGEGARRGGGLGLGGPAGLGGEGRGQAGGLGVEIRAGGDDPGGLDASVRGAVGVGAAAVDDLPNVRAGRAEGAVGGGHLEPDRLARVEALGVEEGGVPVAVDEAVREEGCGEELTHLERLEAGPVCLFLQPSGSREELLPAREGPLG